jgi:hypothetical protein
MQILKPIRDIYSAMPYVFVPARVNVASRLLLAGTCDKFITGQGPVTGTCKQGKNRTVSCDRHL